MDTKNWQVKGSLLLDYIPTIKANKDRPWDKYLTKEDKEILEGRVLPSVWYPFGTFMRCGMAIFHEMARSDLGLVKVGGRISIERLVKNIYKSVVADNDPLKAVERWSQMGRQFYNFQAFSHEKIGEKHVKLTIGPIPEPKQAEIYTAQLSGTFERLIELAGGKNPKITIGKKQWKGDPVTELDMTWE